MIESLQLRVEWLDGSDIRSSELAATFCRLEIWVGGRCISRVEDQRTGGLRDGLFCSAYSLAEWLATRWWSLRWHVRGGVRRRPIDSLLTDLEPRLDPKHDVRTAGDGFLWPELRLLPGGEDVLLIWSERSDVESPIRFLTSGTARLDAEAAFASLSDFIAQVVERLDRAGLTRTLLHEEWRAVTGADAAEATFCRAAAALGLDPYDVSEDVAALLERLGSTLGDELTIEMAEAADLRHLSEDVRWARDAEQLLRSEVLRNAPTGFEAIRARLSHLRPTPGLLPPYRLGWDQAREARAIFESSPESRFPIERFVATTLRPSVDAALQGMALGEPDRVGVVVGMRASNEAPSRFLAGRALWRALHSPPSRPFLLTNASTWAHRVERAFTAELLAPAEGLRQRLNDPRVVDADTVAELANHFGAAPTLIRHQLENQLQVAVGDW